MKKLGLLYAVLIFFMGMGVAAQALEVEFHGDLNNRFQRTNRADFLSGGDTGGVINEGSADRFFGELKYRLWLNASTNDGKVKGVVATEIGGIRFGEDGGDYSGDDDTSFELRWAYTDFQLPWVERNARFKMGLLPFTVNKYIWQETVGGVVFESTLGDIFDYELGWARGREFDDSDPAEDNRTDHDSFLARLNYNPGGAVKAGVFGLFQTYDADSANTPGELESRDYEIKLFDDTTGFNLYSVGVDGGFKGSPIFINWDLIYQTGKVEDAAFTDFASGLGRSGNFDVSAYFVHLDVGANLNKFKLQYTFWYTSGDDDPQDDEFNAFLATDIDINDSIALMEGNYGDDDYFTERHYIADKGFIMNRLGLDYNATEKFTLGGAVLYMMTAEDFEYTAAGSAQSNNELGLEFDVYLKYMLYENVELAWSAGYLIAGDAMDVFEVPAIRNGSADEDIWISSARIRYQF